MNPVMENYVENVTRAEAKEAYQGANNIEEENEGQKR